MGIEAIVDAIAADAAARVEALREETINRVDEILDRARTTAADEERRWAASRDDEAELASARIVNRARMDADRQLGVLREQLFQGAIERLRGLLAGVATSPAYESVFRTLFSEASATIGRTDAVVLVRPEDRELALQLIADMGGGRVESILDCSGGLDIEAADGRSVRNTFEARLTRCDRLLRRLAVKRVAEFASLRTPDDGL